MTIRTPEIEHSPEQRHPFGAFSTVLGVAMMPVLRALVGVPVAIVHCSMG